MPEVSTDVVMDEVRERIRVRIREELARHGAAAELQDPGVFAEVETLLHAAVGRPDHGLVLQELLGDPAAWQLRTAMTYQSHRAAVPARVLIGLKRRVLMPVMRWLFEYSRDNFERQKRVNLVLFACVQELALETAKLRRERDQPRS